MSVIYIRCARRTHAAYWMPANGMRVQHTHHLISGTANCCILWRRQLHVRCRRSCTTPFMVHKWCSNIPRRHLLHLFQILFYFLLLLLYCCIFPCTAGRKRNQRSTHFGWLACATAPYWCSASASGILVSVCICVCVRFELLLVIIVSDLLSSPMIYLFSGIL